MANVEFLRWQVEKGCGYSMYQVQRWFEIVPLVLPKVVLETLTRAAPFPTCENIKPFCSLDTFPFPSYHTAYQIDIICDASLLLLLYCVKLLPIYELLRGFSRYGRCSRRFVTATPQYISLAKQGFDPK